MLTIRSIRNTTFLFLVCSAVVAMNEGVLAYHTWNSFLAAVNSNCSYFYDTGPDDPLMRDVS